MNAMMKPALRAELDKLKGPFFEKNIPFMYVDTTGEPPRICRRLICLSHAAIA